MSLVCVCVDVGVSAFVCVVKVWIDHEILLDLEGVKAGKVLLNCVYVSACVCVCVCRV